MHKRAALIFVAVVGAYLMGYLTGAREGHPSAMDQACAKNPSMLICTWGK